MILVTDVEFRLQQDTGNLTFVEPRFFRITGLHLKMGWGVTLGSLVNFII